MSSISGDRFSEDRDIYCLGCVYLDNVFGYVFVYFQPYNF